VKRREFIVLLGSAAGLRPLAALAQQKAIRVLGFLYDGPSVKTSIPRAALGRGLEETGYVDGINLRIVYRTSAEELISEKAEVIIVAAGGSMRQAKGATTSIPLLFIAPFDPVSAGVVASFNRPGGNITGVSILSVELMPKRLQLLRELVPEAKTCAVLINPSRPGGERSRVELQQAADGMGLTLVIVSTRAEIEFEAAFAKIAALKVAALLVTTDPLFTGGRDRLVALAGRFAVPASYPWREFVLAGGLISYGPSLSEAYRQVGIYAGKILKGAKPADLPVQQPTTFELVVNLNTAKALGLTVPPSILARADEVIE
jgi:putative tryptophan/tyrosine transport system substrate-binding protein